jgi:acetyl-CoA carboxylase biotin carboxyl carrier protein
MNMEDMKMAKLTTAEMIEAIKELSVLELNELVKAIEEEFGVTAAAPVAEESSLASINSPMVGTFYGASSPGAPAFVKEGDSIVEGQVLCIVEAMKLMNEVKADKAGVIAKVLMKMDKL